MKLVIECSEDLLKIEDVLNVDFDILFKAVCEFSSLATDLSFMENCESSMYQHLFMVMDSITTLFYKCDLDRIRS